PCAASWLACRSSEHMPRPRGKTRSPKVARRRLEAKTIMAIASRVGVGRITYRACGTGPRWRCALDWHEARRVLNCDPTGRRGGCPFEAPGPMFIGVKHINRSERRRGPGVTAEPRTFGPALPLVAEACIGRIGIASLAACIAATLLFLAAVGSA